MKLRKTVLTAAIILVMALVSVSLSEAKVGVGVNLGKISVDELLMPGGIYRLPSITVINTGDETKDYGLDATYHYQQKELEPPAKWFIFSPATFELAPGKSQAVDVKLNLPLNARPGDYFAYLEAHPIVKGKKGVTIGVAAATKLYFTIKPANIFSAILYKILTFFETFAPYSYIGVGLVVLIAGILVFRRYFRIRFGIERKA